MDVEPYGHSLARTVGSVDPHSLTIGHGLIFCTLACKHRTQVTGENAVLVLTSSSGRMSFVMPANAAWNVARASSMGIGFKVERPPLASSTWVCQGPAHKQLTESTHR